MTGSYLDLVLALCLVSTAVGGWRLGFITRIASWILMVVGVVLVIHLLPLLLDNFPNLAGNQRLLIVIGALIGGGLLGQMVGILMGSRLISFVPHGAFRVGDHVLGGVAGVFGFLIAAWLVLPAAANVPGFPAQQIRSSEIAQVIYDLTPSPGGSSQALEHLLGGDAFPTVFSGLALSPNAGPAPVDVPLNTNLVAQISRSTVKVEGTACHRTQAGSGFAVATDLIVTNAHVVAGEPDTEVILPDGAIKKATVVAFDASRDIALLRVPNLGQTPLQIQKASVGDLGAVFGHPGGQDALDIQPAKVSQSIVAEGRDLYDQVDTRRNVLILSAKLRQGDSGGALVDTDGKLMGVAFAIAPDQSNTAYALDVSELQAVLNVPHNRAVDTGDCLTD